MPSRKTRKSEEGMDEEDIAYEPEAAEDKVAKLKKELAECRKERQEYLDGWQRLKADIINAKQGDGERTLRISESAKEGVIHELIPVMDSFDMARKSTSWETLPSEWRVGMEQVYAQFEQALERSGATRFGKEGEAFDPTLHEAAQEVAAESGVKEGTIVSVQRSGWKMGTRILRAAQVVVARA